VTLPAHTLRKNPVSQLPLLGIEISKKTPKVGEKEKGREKEKP